MQVFNAQDVANNIPYLKLIEILRNAFNNGGEVPLRTIHSIKNTLGPDTYFGLMPAWQTDGYIAVKLVTIFPNNPQKKLPVIQASIMLFHGQTGVPLAIIDGIEVTRRRTAAASALASTYLSRKGSKYLLMIGTGEQAPHNISAHAAVRPIERVDIWGRSLEKAESLANDLKKKGCPFDVQAVSDLEQSAGTADIISCATSSPDPLIFGDWLQAGTFVDLVGAHTPGTRECDDKTVQKSKIYLDTRAGAMAEAGEILIPLKKGLITEADIIGDLHDLTRGIIEGRQNSEEVILFKSVGTGLEDLAAAASVYENDGLH